MKIERTTDWKYKPRFLKIKLLKSQTYKNARSNKPLKIENIEYRLTKILHIIYHFHINNKTILFIGAPVYFYKELLRLFAKTKHLFIPDNIWVNGAITNQNVILKHLLKTKNNNKTHTEILFQLKKKSDLIVILDEPNNESVLNEGYASKTPVISLNSNIDTMNNKPTYKVPGNFNIKSNNLNNSFFYSILKAILKKEKINSKLEKYKNNSDKQMKFDNVTSLRLINSLSKKKNA